VKGIVLTFVLSIWETLLEMSPYLLVGFLVAGILSVVVRPEIVERHLGGGGLRPVFKASLFGVPLPLCSCGVIPVAASLRRHGASSAAATSFLISTPQTGVDSVMVTLSLLGPVFAVFRPLVSFVSGIVGGSIVASFGEARRGHGASGSTCTEECCTGSESHAPLYRILHYGFVTLPRDINKALLIGVAVAGAIAAVVPEDFFAAVLGGGIVSMLVMMAVGIPVYVCATASVPVAAVLIAKGVSPGAALVFLMTGPATNAATIATVWKIMGKRTAVLYLGTVVLSSFAAGLLLDYVYSESGSVAGSRMPVMLPVEFKAVCALVLVAVLVGAFFRSTKVGQRALKGEGTMRYRILVKGMTCDHCAGVVRRAILESGGVESAEVDFKRGEAIVTGNEVDIGRLRAAIDELGYEFVDAEPVEDRKRS
jgi:uncharacterized membrane protein YraQ (UPF0718 family)/copper chaperone CopZ